MLAVGALAGQAADTSDRPPLALPPEHFPVWSLPPGAVPLPAADTLDLVLPGRDSRQRIGLLSARWLGVGAAAMFSVLAFRTYQQADAAYLAYRRSANPTELDALFKETERLDRRAGWYYAGAEAGLVLATVSVVLGR